MDELAVLVPSSFVFRTHKAVGEGSGEAKLYVGNVNDELTNFFNGLRDDINGKLVMRI